MLHFFCNCFAIPLYSIYNLFTYLSCMNLKIPAIACFSYASHILCKQSYIRIKEKTDAYRCAAVTTIYKDTWWSCSTVLELILFPSFPCLPDSDLPILESILGQRKDFCVYSILYTDCVPLIICPFNIWSSLFHFLQQVLAFIREVTLLIVLLFLYDAD